MKRVGRGKYRLPRKRSLGRVLDELDGAYYATVLLFRELGVRVAGGSVTKTSFTKTSFTKTSFRYSFGRIGAKWRWLLVFDHLRAHHRGYCLDIGRETVRWGSRQLQRWYVEISASHMLPAADAFRKALLKAWRMVDTPEYRQGRPSGTDGTETGCCRSTQKRCAQFDDPQSSDIAGLLPRGSAEGGRLDTGRKPIGQCTRSKDSEGGVVMEDLESIKEAVRKMAHPACNVFPLMDDGALRALAADISRHGQLDPVVLAQDKTTILDGRNRVIACMLAGVKPWCVEWEGEGDPTAWIISRNLSRRHLDESRRAMVGARLKKSYEEAAKTRMLAGKAASPYPPYPPANSPEGMVRGEAREQAAVLAGVSPRLVQDACTVIQEGVPELVEAVDQGLVAVSAAAQIARCGREQQKQIVAMGPKAMVQAAKAVRADRPPVPKQREHVRRPGIKTVRTKIKQIQAYTSEYDVVYRRGVVVGIMYALGHMQQEEYLLHPPETIPEELRKRNTSSAPAGENSEDVGNANAPPEPARPKKRLLRRPCRPAAGTGGITGAARKLVKKPRRSSMQSCNQAQP